MRNASPPSHRSGPATLPHDDDSDATHHDVTAWLCAHVLDCNVAAVFTRADYGEGIAAALSARFRRHRDARQAEVRHVQVDRDRCTVLISGSVARRDPHTRRGFLSPVVYADFVHRVCVLGGESSGKDPPHQPWCSARIRAATLRERDGVLVCGDLLHITSQRLEHEQQQARHADHWLICDTSPLTTLLYCRDLFGRAEAELAQLANHRYDHTLLCATDLPFVQEGPAVTTPSGNVTTLGMCGNGRRGG